MGHAPGGGSSLRFAVVVGMMATCAVAAPPADKSVKVFRVVGIPLAYGSPPSASDVAVQAYNATLPKVTQAALQESLARIAAWWSVETYSEHQLEIRVLPAVSIPGSPACDAAKIVADGRAAAKATQVEYDKLVLVTPYSCWRYHMITMGNVVISWNTQQAEPGQLAHEIGHSFGLGHSASRLDGVYNLYGSPSDQMGPGSNGLQHFLSDHKERLGVLTPKPCASASLASIYTTRDAIRCGDYFIDYLPDWQQVWVHKRELVGDANYGGSDTTDVARLGKGQSYSADGYTFTHSGNGKVTVTR